MRRPDDYCPTTMKSIERDRVFKLRRLYSGDRRIIVDGETVQWANLEGIADYHTVEACDFYVHPYLSGSDYSGGDVVRSNVRVFLAAHGDVPGVHELSGEYGSHGVAVRLDAITEEMAEVFASLDCYPILDEDDQGQLEMESEDEAWESWARHDFIKAVILRGEEADADDVERALDDMDGRAEQPPRDDVWEIFHEACEASNTYWEHNDEGPYLDVKRVAAVVTPVRLPCGISCTACKGHGEIDDVRCKGAIAFEIEKVR